MRASLIITVTVQPCARQEYNYLSHENVLLAHLYNVALLFIFFYPPVTAINTPDWGHPR